MSKFKVIEESRFLNKEGLNEVKGGMELCGKRHDIEPCPDITSYDIPKNPCDGVEKYAILICPPYEGRVCFVSHSYDSCGPGTVPNDVAYAM